MSNLKADLDFSPDLTRLLETPDDVLLTRQDMATITAMVQQQILGRTKEGEFLNVKGKSPYTRAYYLKRRREKGYQNKYATLFYSGNMLKAMTGDVVFDEGVPVAEVCYYQEKTDEDIWDLASYHQSLGAGTNKVVRKFVGVTDEEADDIRLELQRLLDSHLK